MRTDYQISYTPITQNADGKLIELLCNVQSIVVEDDGAETIVAQSNVIYSFSAKTLIAIKPYRIDHWKDCFFGADPYAGHADVAIDEVRQWGDDVDWMLYETLENELQDCGPEVDEAKFREQKAKLNNW